jgi:hypothetical protein
MMKADLRGRVIELWCWGMPDTYIAKHLEIPVDEVRKVVGRGNGSRR